MEASFALPFRRSSGFLGSSTPGRISCSQREALAACAEDSADCRLATQLHIPSAAMSSSLLLVGVVFITIIYIFSSSLFSLLDVSIITPLLPLLLFPFPSSFSFSSSVSFFSSSFSSRFFFVPASPSPSNDDPERQSFITRSCAFIPINSTRNSCSLCCGRTRI